MTTQRCSSCRKMIDSADYRAHVDACQKQAFRGLKGHRPCPECGNVLIAFLAQRCFRCGDRDAVFEELDRMIAAGVTERAGEL